MNEVKTQTVIIINAEKQKVEKKVIIPTTNVPSANVEEGKKEEDSETDKPSEDVNSQREFTFFGYASIKSDEVVR